MIYALRDRKDAISRVADYVVSLLEQSQFARDMPIERDVLQRFLTRAAETMDVEVLFNETDGVVDACIGVYVDEIPYNSFLWGHELFFAAKNPIVAVRIVDKALRWLHDIDRVIGATFCVSLGIDNDRASRFLVRMGLENSGSTFTWRK